MGRPLKIAKAQAILTVTNTTATTNIVTVSQNLSNLGVIAGMPFVPSTTTGTNLIAGTTYWILQITGASTFTVSATELSANPTYTPVTLTTGTTASSLSVGVVDSGFNNPEGIANTYGVVGGNTAIYGNQVLARVAIGVAGTGTIYSYNDSNVVGGAGTDFANTLSAGSVVSSVDSQTGALTTIGFVDTVTGYVTIECSDATATGNFLTSVGNAETLYANLPVTFDVNIGGLNNTQTYFVKEIVNAAAFTVSFIPGGANVPLSDETVTSNATQDQVLLDAVALANASGTSFVYADNEAGFILRQKGKQKYLVQGATSGLIAQCLTANLANAALVPNSMNILATYANSATQFVQSLSDIDSELFTATSGPIASGNIVLANADPVYVTFNSGVAANTANGLIYELVQIAGA